MVILEKIDGRESNIYSGGLENYPLIFVEGVLRRLGVGQDCSASGFDNVSEAREFAKGVDSIIAQDGATTYEVSRHEGALDVIYRRLS
jgi:hypothetical protein